MLTKSWNGYRPLAGEKVVWVELTIAQRPLSFPMPGAHRPPETGHLTEIASKALMERALEGLR